MTEAERAKRIEADPVLRAARERAREALRREGLVLVPRQRRTPDGIAYTEVETVPAHKIAPGGSA